MKYTLTIYFLYFIILSTLGWIMEVTLQLINKRKFLNRGFLIGPYCPIYGCGGILITAFLTNLKLHPMALFCTAIAVCGVLEYLTSYFMEKIFNARWWDYSDKKFNINGRVCLETIIPFGLLGLVLIYAINPFVFDNLIKIPNTVINSISIIVLIIFTMDILISLKVISNVKLITKKINNENPKDNTEEISKKVIEFLKTKSFLNRRLIDAFPKFRASLKEKTEKIKRQTEKIKTDIVNITNEVKEDIEDKVSEIKSDLSENAVKLKNKLKDEKKQDRDNSEK